MLGLEYGAVRLELSSDEWKSAFREEYELLSQSKSVIGSVGQKKSGYKMWMKMVSFDEDELTAKRKYVLIEDEKPKALFVEPWASFKFNCQMVLDAEVLDEPYSNENARRIAILIKAQENALE